MCLSPRECSERGGLSEGSCASGFGACCLFISRSESYKTSFWTLRKYVALIKMSLVDQSIKVNQYFYSMETTGGGVAHLDSKVGYLQNPAYPQVPEIQQNTPSRCQKCCTNCVLLSQMWSASLNKHITSLNVPGPNGTGKKVCFADIPN